MIYFNFIGADLSKLVTKSILLLENIDGKVVGLTNDGATTNRTMWKLLGISTNEDDFKNYSRIHLTHLERYLYFLIHLI